MVRISNVQHIGPSEHGLHIKTAASRGGYIRDVIYHNISLGDIVADSVISLTTSYGESDRPATTAPHPSAPLTELRDIHYALISRAGPKISDKGAGSWTCFADAPCYNVTMADVNLSPAAGWSCKYLQNATAAKVVPADGLDACFVSP